MWQSIGRKSALCFFLLIASCFYCTGGLIAPKILFAKRAGVLLFANNNNNNNNKPSASQQERRDEDKRRKDRSQDVVIGKTSAIPGAQNFPIDPEATVKQYLQQASSVERLVYTESHKGIQCLIELDVEGAGEAFEKVLEVRPNSYLWQAGVVHFYKGNYKRASDILATSIDVFETKFGEVCTMERIWRDAAELKFLSTLTLEERENINLADHIYPVPQKSPGSRPLGKEMGKAHRIAGELFDASIRGDHSGVTIARAKLRSLCEGELHPRKDIKQWKLDSLFFLGLHYDVMGEEKDCKECMWLATRLCPPMDQVTELGKARPYLHLSQRGWLDQEEDDDDDSDDNANELDAVPQGLSSESKTNPLAIASIRNSIAKMNLNQLQDAMKARGLLLDGGKDVLAERLFRVLLEDMGIEDF